MSFGDKVRRLRAAKNMTQMQLVAAVKKRGGDLSQPQLSAIEKGDVERPGALLEIAAALGTTAGDLLGLSASMRQPPQDDQDQTPIAHYVGAGDEVHLFDGDGDIDYTAGPPGFGKDSGAAAIVRGDSMRPLYDPGDMLFFRHSRPPPAATKDLPARAVIVEIAGGRLYVKKLLPGTRRGRFHLLSVNPLTQAMQDQAVEGIAQIEWVKPKLS